MTLADDVGILLGDLFALGLACQATYGASTIAVAIEDAGQPPSFDAVGEITSRTATATVARAQVPTPAKGESLVVASGSWAGTWYITEVGGGDDGAWSLTLQADALTAARSPNARRLAGGGA